MILWQVMDIPSQTQAQLYEDDNDLMFTSDRSDSTTSALNALDWFSSQTL